MIPQIFNLGPIPVNSFGLLIALAFFAAIERLRVSFAKNGIPEQLAETFVFVGGLVGLLGARIWFILENIDYLEGQILSALFSSSGFTFYGGFIFSTATLVVLCRYYGVRVSSFLDSVGPALTLGYAIGRLGCQLSGDGCYGLPTTSIFGMSYEGGVVPTEKGVLVFPTPLYESAWSLLIVFILTALEGHPRWLAPLKRFGAYLLLIAPERFFVEFLRQNPKVLGSLSEAQVIAVVLFMVGLALLLLSGRGAAKPAAKA